MPTYGHGHSQAPPPWACEPGARQPPPTGPKTLNDLTNYAEKWKNGQTAVQDHGVSSWGTLMFKSFIVIVCAFFAWGLDTRHCPKERWWFIFFGAVQTGSALHLYAAIFLRAAKPKHMTAEDTKTWSDHPLPLWLSCGAPCLFLPLLIAVAVWGLVLFSGDIPESGIAACPTLHDFGFWFCIVVILCQVALVGVLPCLVAFGVLALSNKDERTIDELERAPLKGAWSVGGAPGHVGHGAPSVPYNVVPPENPYDAYRDRQQDPHPI